MKSLLEKIEGLNFKKAFTTFFVAFLVYVIVYVSVAVTNGQWNAAVNFERNRMETRQSMITEQESGGARGRIERSNQERVRRSHQRYAATEGTANEPGNPGNRLLNAPARAWVRMTSGEFDIFRLLGHLFQVAFNLLLASWVYVDSKKHDKNKILWPVLTLFTSIVGWVLYLIVRESKWRMQKAGAE